MPLTLQHAPAHNDVSKTAQEKLQTCRFVQIQLWLCPVDEHSLPCCFLPELPCACTDVEDPQAHGA
eukprot:8853572-Karenia_brevis.AAC.1